MQTVQGIERQCLGGKLEPIGKQTPTQASTHRLQRQGLEVAAQRHTHLRQGNIGRGAHHLSLADIDPGAKGTVALLQIDANLGIAPQL